MKRMDKLFTLDSAVHFFALETKDLASAKLDQVRGSAAPIARTVRGRKMRTLSALFDEFAAALQFPSYFGENMDAFNECISDLNWLSVADPIVVLVTDPHLVLELESGDVLRWFVSTMRSAIKELGLPITVGEWWDRPGIPVRLGMTADRDTLALARKLWNLKDTDVILVRYVDELL